MTETKQSIPAEVIEQAAKAYFLASDKDIGFDATTWEADADETTKEQFRWAASQMAPIIAAWARNEALREAAKTARTTTLTLDDIDYEAQVIAEAILELVEERVTIPNPDHTPLGKYEVID